MGYCCQLAMGYCCQLAMGYCCQLAMGYCCQLAMGYCCQLAMGYCCQLAMGYCCYYCSSRSCCCCHCVVVIVTVAEAVVVVVGLTCPEWEESTGWLLAFEVLLHLLESSKDPPKRPISSSNQNTETLHIAKRPETRDGTTLGQVPHLMRVQVAAKSGKKLHPLVTSTLAVDENQ